MFFVCLWFFSLLLVFSSASSSYFEQYGAVRTVAVAVAVAVAVWRWRSRNRFSYSQGSLAVCSAVRETSESNMKLLSALSESHTDTQGQAGLPALDILVLHHCILRWFLHEGCDTDIG